MAIKLKEALRKLCTFPNPVYQLIALRRQLTKNMHEAVATQHRQRKAAFQLNVSIAKFLEKNLSLDAAQAQPDVVSAIKPKEKVTREAALGIQVLVSLLNDLRDPAVATLAHRREFLDDLLPFLRNMGFLALSPRRGGLSPGTEIAEFTEKIQRFLLDMCPRPIGISTSSPKLPLISSGELDVLDRTNAVNGLIHLAAATGSVRDFLVVLRVLLGANESTSDSAKKDLRSSLSSRSLLTSSVPSLKPMRDEELFPSPRREDEEMAQVRMGVTRSDLNKLQKGSLVTKRETDVSAAQDSLKRKTLLKGLKTISSNASTATLNLAMSHSSSPHHRLLYGSPGNNLVSKQRTEDGLEDDILMENTCLSLDMSKMKEILTRETITTSRSETPVVTARCPKVKALNIQSVLVALDRAKPSVPTRVLRDKPTSSIPISQTDSLSDTSEFIVDDDDGDREVWSCGQNSYGELGHGDTASRKSFERIESLQQKDIVQIGAGNEHTIVLTADGKALSCGYNDNGQCGQGGTARVSHLSEIPKMGENNISQVHAYNGCEHTILVTMDGRAATCGYNYRGQLGHGNTASESVPKIIRSLENKIVRLISCSYYHTVMACEEDGSGQQYVYTFGRNDYGQLGHNDSIDRKVPQHVEALNDQQIVSVACGQYHTMVVTATGKAFAFGKNDYGQLGIDAVENQLIPVQVGTGLEKQECLEIRCGYYHTIVLCSGAHLFGFGRNDYGQLGLGRVNASSAANLQLQQQRFSCARLIEELEGKDIVRFACGCYHTVAASDNGVMYVFGRNNHGQLGTGDTNERLYPSPIDDFVGKRIALIAAGFYHTVVLTGGNDDEKNDQDAVSNAKGENSTQSTLNGITHAKILSAPVVQELLDPNKRPELDTQPSSGCQLQMYMLLACIRILQANISQMLRSGMAKTIILLSPDPTVRKLSNSGLKNWAKELDRTRVAILQVREVLLSLIDIKHRRNICYVLDNAPNEGENVARIADEATTTLMQGFELFFPCQCLQRQFCMNVMHELSNDSPEHSCGAFCRRDLWLIDSLPKNKVLVLEPLLRRMTEDSLVKLQDCEGGRVSLVTEVYQLLLERIAADFSRRIGDVVAVRPTSGFCPRSEATLRAFFDTLGGLQKHISSWAASEHEWVVKGSTEVAQERVSIEAKVAIVVDRVFRVDEQDLDCVPISWRCFIEFTLATLGQCCEVLGQAFPTDSHPSPTNGFDNHVELGTGLQDNSLYTKMLEVVEYSIVGQFLPLLVVSLFEFSNNSLFAAALLPTLKTLLRLLDGFNERDNAVEDAERNFVENVASSFNPQFLHKEGTGTFRHKSASNLLSLGTARDEDMKNTSRKGLGASDSKALPWNYRLEKELAVLAAEMAVTLVIGDHYFTYEDAQDPDKTVSTKLSERWLLSPLFRGGLNSNCLVESIKHTSTTRPNPIRIVHHTPFQITIAATKLCDWVRDSYAKKDPSYRMIMRQSQLSTKLKMSGSPVEKLVHENDAQIELAVFAALLHHNMLGTQAYHFAFGISRFPENRPSPPRAFLNLWQCVAQLRRRVAAKKTEIKNMPHPEADSSRESPFDRIVALQQTILDRCKLLLLVDVYEEEEHRNLQLDGGYIAPYDPAFLVSASLTFKLSVSSVKRHLQTTYTDEKLPFLAAFPSSKWRTIRMLLHTIIRWKFVAAEFQANRLDTSTKISQEILAYVTSDELLSSTNAIKTLLVDPCQRVSCSIRGLENLWELLTLVSFDSVQADIVHQISQVFVFQSTSRSILTGSRRVGYFYSSLQNQTFSELVGQLTEMMTDKAALLMEANEMDATSTFWIVIVLLSAWGVHFKSEQFEFVSDIGILGNLTRLEETLWVLFRYICVHFAEQNVENRGANGCLQQGIYVPTFPVLSGVTELLYNEAVSISNGFLPLQASVDGVNMQQAESPPVIPAVRRSFEVITLPQRFSAQSKGATFSYDNLISPSGSSATAPMSPLVKPNEFSVTTWLYVNASTVQISRTASDNLFDLPHGLQRRQLVFMRGAAREIALYLVLVPETIDNWQLEVGILMDLNRDADAGELTIKGRMWERILSKQVVAAGKWIHVAVVLEATKLRLYLNGVLDCQRSLVAQSIPIWAAGNVDLPLHFGRFPTELGTNQTITSVTSAITFLSRSLGIMKSSNWDPVMIPSNNATSASEKKTGAFRCFDGWLSHFRFHNRSLSPIHVRIVFDEKKSPSGLLANGLVSDHSKIVELHVLLMLLSSSSEGLVHFSSQYSRWMRLVWGTFLGSSSAIVQQSALRLLRVLTPLQSPLEASKVLLRDGASLIPATFGFYELEGVFVQQVIRMVGFCLSKCQANSMGDTSEAVVVPWSLMVARGIHANHFSSEIRPDGIDQQTDLHNDVELRYQSSKRQSLTLANELNQLLQYLFKHSNEVWRQSIINVTSKIVQNFSGYRENELSEPLQRSVLLFGTQALHLSTIKCVESRGCMYFLSGGVEFLRPGVTVQMRGSQEFAQVLSLEYQNPSSSQNPPETPPDAKVLPQALDTLAYVHIDSNSEPLDGGKVLHHRHELAWEENVFGSTAENVNICSKVSIEELNPAKDSNRAYPSIIYDIASKQNKHNLFNVLVEKAAEVIPALFSVDDTHQRCNKLGSMNVSYMLLKILVQIAGTNAGVGELLAKPALINVIMGLAVDLDNNPKHETLYHVEKRLSTLRREIYTALVELGAEGDVELARLLDSSSEKRSDSVSASEKMPSLRDLDGETFTFSTSRGTERRSRSFTDAIRMNGPGLSDADDDQLTHQNWDPAQGEGQEAQILTPNEDDNDDDGEDEDDDDGSLEDGDNDEEDEDDAEESRAEFVEELMLMGFPEDWCVLALKQTDNDIVSASAWIVDNLEYLSNLQSTLDKERDKGRDSPRFDEEEDDVVPSDDTPSDSVQHSQTENGEDTTKNGSQNSITSDMPVLKHKIIGCDDDSFTAPPLNDKEMGRKLFGEMYFPFEDGGFLSNTKSRFMRSWRTDTMETKVKSVPTSPQPIDDVSNTQRSPFEEDLQTDTNQLDLKGLVKQLRTCENTLSILYARQFMVTLLHQMTSWGFTTGSTPSLLVPYTKWFNLLKLVMLRGDQFSILSTTNTTTTFDSQQLQEFSIDSVFLTAFRHFIDHDCAAFASVAFEFCLSELEIAATSKIYEAALWTHRDLRRSDKIVAEDPGVEVAIWMLDTLLAGPTGLSFTFSLDFAKAVLRRLRCCLGTTNLPLKFVVLRIISRMMIALGNQDKDMLKESQLVVGEFLSAAITRHTREVIQGRLLFSLYIQGYIELLHVLQYRTGFSDLNVAHPLYAAPITQDFGAERQAAAIQPNPKGQSLLFDRKRSRSSLLAFAEDGFSVSYSGNDMWKAACAVAGFSTGVHSWIVRIEKSSSPYLFVGIATRQANLDSFLGSDDQSWGFIGDKALYYQRNRVRAYGETFTEGDSIGLRLDCEKGELSFSKNGVDLGVAFDNIVGEVCPAVAFYSRHQKISFEKESCVSSSGTSEPQISPTGEDSSARVEDCLIACEIMSNWVANKSMRGAMSTVVYNMTSEWLNGSTKFVTTRSGKTLWVDVTRAICGKLGFYADDRVRTPRGNGVVVGVAGGRIWVEVDNEPGAWFFHPSKLRLVAVTSSTASALLVPVPHLRSNDQHTSRKDSGDADSTKSRVESDSTSVKDAPSLFQLSSNELVVYGEHSLWNIATDRELLSVINDFCEVSRFSPWNLTPTQLINLVKEKTAVLELTSVSSILAMPQEKLEKMVVARFALLRFCNMYVSRSLPFFDLTWYYFLPDSNSLPCRLISQCRGSLFVCVKNTLWTALMERTANSPKKADDEYDYPEDLPQLQVNRLKAAAAKCHEGSVSSLFLSLFGQAFEELHFLPLKTLRMVYSHPMDDGQLRSFKVKFEGEGVDDYGGPYREFFSQFFAELQMLHVPQSENSENKLSDNYSTNGDPSSISMKLDPGVSVSTCVLPFLIPSPNWRNGVGANREKFVLNGTIIINSFGDVNNMRSSPGESAEEKRQLYCEMFYFLGQMIGICLRTRVCVRLDLAMSVWKQLVAQDDSNPENALETLKEIDFVAYSLWKTLNGISDEFKRIQDCTTSTKWHQLQQQLEAMDLVFTTVLSDGRTIELCEDGTNTAVTLTNLDKYLNAMLQARVGETQEVMNIVKQGLHSIMPVSALALLTWTELEKRMCGVAEVDVKLLQDNTEYDEELSPNDEFIQRFWRVLESLESEDRRAFLRFVWARSRLPLGSAQFHQKFKIQALASSGTGDGNGATATCGWMDSQMPKSHTCFFALQLPRYSSDEICRERLLYAVRNCVEMDGDFRLADTEMTGWAGISPTDQLRI
ncbi:HECT E3 ubiquitin ligase [Phytophthora megakarya]|uniref:HECT E3 ubiquitin ligase n=1 Tax=Phytophthora megakarya TaxID=4795 RepID=A0A225X1V6_9STRA|nr:HECT E3 ubiquitin ligase [Phytophthora megakarya]